MVKIPEWWIETIVESLVNDKILEKPMDWNHGNLHPKSSDFTESWVPFIMASDISNGKVDFKNCYYISEATNNTLQKWFAKPWDVLLTHKATIWKVALLWNEYPSITLTPQVTYYRVLNHDKLDNKYLYYYFLSPYFQNIFAMWSWAWSTRAYLWITDQRKLPIILPPLPEQKAIAGVLSAFDDKIELLRAENQTLEEMGQTLFKEWFGKCKVWDELPDGWKVGKITEIIKRESVSYKCDKDDLDKDWTTPIIDQWTTWLYWYTKREPDFIASKENPVIVFTNHTCNFWFIDYPFCAIQNVLPYRWTNWYNERFLYFMTKWSISFIEYKWHRPNFVAIDFIIPPVDLADKFWEIAKTILNKISYNKEEIKKLSETRDQLLPKLMSWEVRVEF